MIFRMPFIKPVIDTTGKGPALPVNRLPNQPKSFLEISGGALLYAERHSGTLVRSRRLISADEFTYLPGGAFAGVLPPPPPPAPPPASCSRRASIISPAI